MDAIYWVISRDCNQRCPHCYNNSEPGAPGLSEREVDRCVESLPDPGAVEVQRIILSGGEVLVWPDLLIHTLDRLNERFGDATRLWVQTNGDLLDEAMLERLLRHHVQRIDIASMDHFHRKSTVQRRGYLEDLFQSFGMQVDGRDCVPERDDGRASASSHLRPTYAFWGANEDEWIGPIWPRGRAQEKKLSKAKPEDRFCSIWSGAKNFLNYQEKACEVNIQLSDVYPCCPMTFRPLGSLLNESLTTMLDRCRQHPVFRALNEGNPEAMGESMGISEEFGVQRTRELGNHCLWCDEFFAKYAPELLAAGAVTERGIVDLVQIGWTDEIHSQSNLRK